MLFTRLLHKIKSNEIFIRWSNKDATGEEFVPIELLFLGFLRYVGQGFTMDDLEECTSISAETHRQFILKIIEYGSTQLWNEYVIKTVTNADAEYNTELFASAGFPGCIGSVDSTHVLMSVVQIGPKMSTRDIN